MIRLRVRSGCERCAKVILAIRYIPLANLRRRFTDSKNLEMRQLTEDRTKILFEKLSKYIGSNTKMLIDRPDGTYCFREMNNRVYYASENILKHASNVDPDKLISVGVCFGKFTKSGKFRLHITALHYISPYAQCKVWVKPNAEQQVVYGHNVLKSGLGRITENTSQYQGVVIYSMNDIPLGFGVTAKSTAQCKHADPLTVVCFTQSDIAFDYYNFVYTNDASTPTIIYIDEIYDYNDDMYMHEVMKTKMRPRKNKYKILQ